MVKSVGNIALTMTSSMTSARYAGSKAAPEATGNYYPIYDTLDNHLDVQVADPRQTKGIGTAQIKNDRLDAKLLAQLCRGDMIAESHTS